MERLHIILDVDETLIHASHAPIDTELFDFRVGQYYVYPRPHLTDFLTECAALGDVAIWSSASLDYVQQIVARIAPPSFQPTFIWGSEHCTQRRNLETDMLYWRKDIKKIHPSLGWSKNRIIAIDDSPEKWETSYGNYLRVKAFEGSLVRVFEGNQNDNELARLIPYLRYLATVPNIRAIEKRYWRQYINDLPA
jgi:carboxy-terminal domain RNA polymerase II polypeptide A small phosphatase